MSVRDAFNGSVSDAFSSSSSGGAVPAAASGFWYRDDMANISLGTSALGGGGAASNITPGSKDHPGIVQLFVSAAADRATWTWNNGWVGEIKLGAGNTLTIEWCVNLATISDGTNNITFRVGMGDVFLAGTDQVNAIYFETDWATHGNANTWFGCTADGGVRTKTSLGVAPVASVFTKLKIVATSVSVQFYVDNALLATVATNIPLTNPMSPVAQAVKQLGAGNIAVLLDYYDLLYAIGGAGR